MNYVKEFMDGYTYYHFDNIYPIKNISFNDFIVNLKWSINGIHYYDTKLEIDNHTVNFQNTHIKHIKLLGDVLIKDISLWEGFIVEEAREVTEVFRRNSGWAGADGVYTHQIGQKIHWYFSDTFIGDVEPSTRIRKPGYAMVNNTLAVSSVDEPFNLEFYVNQKEDTLLAYFKPELEGIYWLQDGIYLENNFYLTVIRVVSTKDSFAVVGVDTLKIPVVGEDLLVSQYERVPSNFYIQNENLTYTFGASILDDRENSGYIYVFGYDDYKVRNAVVSRVKDHIMNDEYEYLSENGWRKEPSQLKSIAQGVACEYKVIYDRGEYLISYTKNGIGNQIMVGKTLSIENGFNDLTCVYDCLENHHKESIITYNAKFQVFSNLEEIYITYHVNTYKNEEHDDAEIYYPRWIILKRRSGNS